MSFKREDSRSITLLDKCSFSEVSLYRDTIKESNSFWLLLFVEPRVCSKTQYYSVVSLAVSRED